MRLQNAGGAWTEWGPYNANLGRSLPIPGDGAKTVNGEFQDAVGTVLPKSDSIILDTVPPVQVSPFLINSGAAYTKSINVILTYAYNGASKMRFKNQSQLSYPDWEDYAASKGLGLSPPVSNRIPSMCSSRMRPAISRKPPTASPWTP